jgi:hypothetical protein
MERLQDSRVWMVGGALAAVLIVAVSWIGFIGPEVSSARDLRDQTAITHQQNAVLLAKEQSLEAKSARLPQYTSSLREAQAGLPYDSGLPAFTRQLAAQARAHRVAVDSVFVGAVSPVDSATPTPPTSGATTNSAPATGATPPAVAAGLYSMQVTVQSTGPLRRQLAFLDAIRTAGPRRALITSTQVSPGAGSKVGSIDRAASFTIEMAIFSAPRTPTEIGQLKRLLNGDIGD